MHNLYGQNVSFATNVHICTAALIQIFSQARCAVLLHSCYGGEWVKLPPVQMSGGTGSTAQWSVVAILR